MARNPQHPGDQVRINGELYPLARQVNEEGVEGPVAFQIGQYPLQDGNSSAEQRVTYDDWSRGIGDGLGRVRGAVSYGVGLTLDDEGRIRPGPEINEQTGGSGVINDMVELGGDGYLYLATTLGLARMRYTTWGNIQGLQLSPPLAAVPLALQVWQGSLLIALGDDEPYAIRDTALAGHAGINRNGDTASVFGISRTAGSGATLVRGRANAWSRLVRHAEPVTHLRGNLPRNFAILGENQRIRVLWHFPRERENLDSFEIRHREYGTTAWTSETQDASTSSSVRGDSLEIGSLTPGQNYEVQMRSVYVDGGDTTYSSWTSSRILSADDPVTSSDGPDLETPAELEVSPQRASLSLTCRAVEGASFYAWGARRQNRPDSGYGSTFALNTLGPSAIIDGLDSGQGYEVTVTARGDGQDSERSAPVWEQTYAPYEGEWGVEYEVGDDALAITSVFSHGQWDWVATDRGLLSFDANGEAVNVLNDLENMVSEKNRRVTSWGGHLLFSTIGGLYRVIPEGYTRTVGIEEVSLNHVRFGPSLGALAFGRYLYEARPLADVDTPQPNETVALLQYRLAEQGDTAPSPYTAVGIVDVFQQVTVPNATTTMLVVQADGPELVYTAGHNLRRFSLLATGAPKPAERDETFANDPDDDNTATLIYHGRPTLAIEGGEYGTYNTPKFYRSVEIVSRGDAQLRVRAAGETLGEDGEAADGYNEFTFAEPDDDDPGHRNMTLIVDLREVAADFEIRSITVNFQERPEMEEGSVIAVRLRGTDAQRYAQKLALEALCDGPPITFVDPFGDEYLAFISRFEGDPQWQFAGHDPTPNVTLAVRRV